MRSIFLHGISLLFVAVFLARVGSASVHAESAVDKCREAISANLQEERRAYRAVQFGQEERSVLGVATANTSDLVPYLVLNYHALDCRLDMLCDAVDKSHGHISNGYCQNNTEKKCGKDADCSESRCVLRAEQSIGCARAFAARGRWWSDDRRTQSLETPIISECAYSDKRESVSAAELSPSQQCNQWVNQILEEERQMLRLLVAQDSAHRGSRRVIGVFQSVLLDIRDSFLEPLRGMADLFGSVIHPIPCFLSHCN